MSSLSPAQSENQFEIIKYKIDEVNIEFKGSQSFDTDQILRIIKSSSEEYFDRNGFILDAERIEKFYFDNGFLDAQVDTSLTFDHNNLNVIETFIIHENVLYKINKIDYVGLENLSTDMTQLIFFEDNNDLKPNQSYSKDELTQEISRILTILQDNGYANASSEPPEIIKILSGNPELKHKLNLKLLFNIGNKFRFGKTNINIRNNKYGISRSDLERELVYKENDIYSKEKLVESENRISKISIVENGSIQIDNVDTVHHIINFKIDAILSNKYEVSPEIFGYEISNRFYGGVGLSFIDRYFFGGGRTLISNARILVHSLDIYGFDLSARIYQPYIFNNPKLTGSYKLGSTIFSEDSLRISGISNEFIFDYELPIYTYINELILDWKIENSRITYTQDIIASDTNLIIIPADANIDIFSSVLGFTAVHNSANNFIFPAQGYIQTYSLEESGLIGGLIKKIFKVSTFNYLKLTSLNRFYLNVSSKPDETSNAVLAAKFLIGSLFEYGENKLKFNGLEQEIEAGFVPIDARYLCGGSSSVRGWGAMELGIVPNKRYGGNFIVEGSFEHRTKPFMNFKSIFKDLGFVTFLDYGNVWENAGKFKLNQIALAIGGGIRYYTIIGPVRFDIGFKLYDPQPGPDGGAKWLFGKGARFEDKYTFQIGIGNTF